ncbi:hypothetical protein ACWGBH_22880 [Streptomyces massasporeus]
MACAHAGLFSPRLFDLTTFLDDEGHDDEGHNDEGHDELVLARVGCLPGARIRGLSDLAGVVEFGLRPSRHGRSCGGRSASAWSPGWTGRSGDGQALVSPARTSPLS